MNKTLCFQVCHSRRNLCGHVEEDGRIELITTAVTKIVQQVAFAHELRHNVERRLSGAHAYTQQQSLVHKYVLAGLAQR